MLQTKNTLGNMSTVHRKTWHKGQNFAPAKESALLLVRIAPSNVGMFRFLLEAYEHLAYFSVLNKYEALLKIVFSPHRERAVREALGEIATSIDLQILPWPHSSLLIKK